MQSEMINIFPTPILYAHDVLDSNSRAELEQILDRIDRRGRVHNPPSWNCNVRSSWGTPNTELNQFIQEKFHNFFAQYQKEVFEHLPRQRLEAWHNYYARGESQEPHEHIGPTATYSGVYILKQREQQARLEFEDPCVMPKRYSGMKEGWLTAPLEQNDLILFPNWLVHRVRDAGDQERVTVAFNSHNT
jgi:hypothetical protein